MVKLNTRATSQFQARTHRDLIEGLRGMKQNDLQQIIEFLINDIADLTSRIELLEKKK